MKKIVPSFEEFVLNEEKKPEEFGCAMLYFNENCLETMYKKIDEKDLYYKDGDKTKFGFEKEPHVTLLYGFHNTAKPEEILKEMKKKKIPKNLLLSNLSIFENKDFDVLKFDTENEDLIEINKHLTENFEYTSDFPAYHPHATVCYLKPGMGKKYIDENAEIIVKCNEVVYSDAKKKHHKFKIN